MRDLDSRNLFSHCSEVQDHGGSKFGFFVTLFSLDFTMVTLTVGDLTCPFLYISGNTERKREGEGERDGSVSLLIRTPVLSD